MSTLDHKERIIQAAYTIGTRGGLAAISARAVAEDAGVSVGYLYKLFPSKSDIMVAAARRYFELSLSRELCRIDSNRSEERRVGKECRVRGMRNHYNIETKESFQQI